MLNDSVYQSRYVYVIVTTGLLGRTVFIVRDPRARSARGEYNNHGTQYRSPFYKQLENNCTSHANGRLLPTWLHWKAVLARTRNSFGILMVKPFAVSSNKKQQFPVIANW